MESIKSLSTSLKTHSSLLYSGFLVLCMFYFYRKKKAPQDSQSSPLPTNNDPSNSKDLETRFEYMANKLDSIESILEKIQIHSPMIKEPKQKKKLNFSLIDSSKKGKCMRIAFTGGPCSGRSIGVNYIADMLRERDYVTYIVPESVTLIEAAGIMTNINKFEGVQLVQFVTTLIRMQIEIENRFIELGTSRNEEKPIVFLIERGIMDNYIFFKNLNLWQTLLDDMGTKAIMLRDKRYDAVFHLVSTVEGLEEVFSENYKDKKGVTLEQAKELEKAYQDAWLGHPNRYVIDNCDKTFENKMKKLEKGVLKTLGLETSFNFCSKFLLKNYDYNKWIFRNSNSSLQNLQAIGPIPSKNFPIKTKTERFLVTDTFIMSNSKDHIVRTRKRGLFDNFLYMLMETKIVKNENVKTKSRISPKDYVSLNKHSDPERRKIEKLRIYFMWNLEMYIVDTFDLYQENPEEKETFSILTVKAQNAIVSYENLPNFLKDFVARELKEDEKTYLYEEISKLNWKMPEKDIFELNPERFSHSPNTSADFVSFYSKKIVTQIAKPDIDDFIREGYECFKICNKSNIIKNENFEHCLRNFILFDALLLILETCFEKWKNLHIFLRSSEYTHFVLSTQNEKSSKIKKKENITKGKQLSL